MSADVAAPHGMYRTSYKIGHEPYHRSIHNDAVSGAREFRGPGPKFDHRSLTYRTTTGSAHAIFGQYPTLHNPTYLQAPSEKLVNYVSTYHGYVHEPAARSRPPPSARGLTVAGAGTHSKDVHGLKVPYAYNPVDETRFQLVLTFFVIVDTRRYEIDLVRLEHHKVTQRRPRMPIAGQCQCHITLLRDLLVLLCR